MGAQDRRQRLGAREADGRKTRTKIEIEEGLKGKIARLARKNFAKVNGFVKKHALDEVRKVIGRRALPEVDDEILSVVERTRPDALVYVVPVVGAKIIASPGEDDGWKGVTFHPDKPGSLFAWTSNDLNLSSWAMSKKTVRAMLFVASRIDDKGLAFFRIPNSKFLISAGWKGSRWEEGFVVDTKSGKRQEWRRAGWLSSMEPGPFNCVVVVRQLTNMLAGTLAVKDGGISHT